MIYKTEAGKQEVERRYRELLDRWPVTAERRKVPTREGETFVLVSGPQDAPPVVIMHGSGANSASMLGFAAAWSKRLRVYNVDLIGEPGLSAPSRPTMGSEAYALWLDDVLDALGLAKTAMLGISLGGWFALDYASRRPERLTRLVLLAPCGLGRLKMGPLIRFLLLRPLGDRGRRKAMKAAIGPMEAGWDDPEMGQFTLVVFKAFRPRLEIPTFGDETLRNLTMPVLVSVGEQDRMLDSPGTKQRFEKVVPQAKVRVLPGVGHLVTDVVAVGEFLDQDG